MAYLTQSSTLSTTSSTSALTSEQTTRQETVKLSSPLTMSQEINDLTTQHDIKTTTSVKKTTLEETSQTRDDKMSGTKTPRADHTEQTFVTQTSTTRVISESKEVSSPHVDSLSTEYVSVNISSSFKNTTGEIVDTTTDTIIKLTDDTVTKPTNKSPAATSISTSDDVANVSYTTTGIPAATTGTYAPEGSNRGTEHVMPVYFVAWVIFLYGTGTFD